MALGGIFVGMPIAPRLGVLKLSERRNIRFFYQIAATAVLVAPTCFAQFYVTTASGALTHVSSAEMIGSAPPSKYYTASSICLNGENALVQHENELGGEHNENLDFHLYVLVPVCGTTERPVWIGFSYSGGTDNSGSDEAKDAAYHDFLERSQAQLTGL